MYFKFQNRPWPGRALAAILAVAAGGCLAAAGADTPSSAPPVATPPAAAPAATGTASVSLENDYATLQRFIELPPERITELRKVLEYLEKMPPAERAALRQHLQVRMENIRQVMDAIGPDTRALPPAERDVLRRYVMTLYPEEAQTLLQKLKAATATEERKVVIQGMLATATARGIKPNPDAGNRSQPGARGGRPPQDDRQRGSTDADHGPRNPSPESKSETSPVPSPAPAGN